MSLILCDVTMYINIAYFLFVPLLIIYELIELLCCVPDEYFDIVQLAMRIKSFRDGKEDWDQYTERLEHFFAANGITEAEKKRSVFLTVIGTKAYKQLHGLISPMKPGETNYKAAMKKHYRPAALEIVQQFQFNSHFWRTGESVSTYVAELWGLAEFCNFGDTLELMLCDRLVCGINDETTQRLLLTESKLTYKKALEIATSQETAPKMFKHLEGFMVYTVAWEHLA